ncbi:MAG: hypothetical protein IPK59_10220 [Rhodospirillaceae bacterium]|nr:hypothetical protein [Rhodospirillaceae bacterium]
MTIGTGGNGGAAAAGSNDGSTGGTSSFGAHVSATGGKGGNGQNGFAAKTNLRDNSGGDGVGGDINVKGEAGYNVASYYGANFTHGTRGGKAAGPIGGPGAHPIVRTSGTVTAGNAAPANSGGGGGGGLTVYNDGSSYAAGGNGGSGLIVVMEYA